MKLKYTLVALSLTIASSLGLHAASDGTLQGYGNSNPRQLKEILVLKEYAMNNRARICLEDMYDEVRTTDPLAYSILCDIMMRTPSCETRMASFIKENPQSLMVNQLRYAYGSYLFDKGDYDRSLEYLDLLPPAELEKNQVDDYLFKVAYCELVRGNIDQAFYRYKELEARTYSDYTSPSRYAMGYIQYLKGNFRESMDWFLKASEDIRFKEISEYYIMECRFMKGDYDYVLAHGEAMYESAPDERKSRLAGILSEVYMKNGSIDKAIRYSDLIDEKSRNEWFINGSALYAAKDYERAIESFNKVENRTDSIGQIVNYQLGACYVQIKNKVAAHDAFMAASFLHYNPSIAEDAHFNYAKLHFDLYDDPTVFNSFMEKYPEREKDDMIYNYIAVAALLNCDYEAAVDAYGMIDDMDEGMTNNYVKANYLRAHQLVKSGSYRSAISYLRYAAYYSDKYSMLNQFARYWRAESHFRNDEYSVACDLYLDLYNQSSLYGHPESYLLPYSIAYCYFMSKDYSSALVWFNRYLESENVHYRKDALERVGDCCFVTKDYKGAAATYVKALGDPIDVNDIYPYYQAALSYGLTGDNAKKMSLLNNVMSASPTSRFYPEALYELGRTYVAEENETKAFECFEKLAGSVSDVSYLAAATIEMGSISRNQSKDAEALKYYKKVVEEMPLSGHVEDALAAIESIYQSKNQPQEYLDYIEKIGKGSTKTPEEKEDMIFNAAEQIYLTKNYDRALTALQSYLESYPSGRNGYKADFYVAEIYRSQGKYEQACDEYKKVIEAGTGTYLEFSLLNFSNISFRQEKWDDAYEGYLKLYQVAVIDENKVSSMTGMMRSAYKGRKWSETVMVADVILNVADIDVALKREAMSLKARSLMLLNRRPEAIDILNELVKDLSDTYGAEAAYLLIQNYFDTGDFESVENQVYAFSDAGSPQVYWLAKSFIVLGDAFVEQGEYVQAHATFDSIRQGYPENAGDDIIQQVEMRISKLEALM